MLWATIMIRFLPPWSDLNVSQRMLQTFLESSFRQSDWWDTWRTVLFTDTYLLSELASCRETDISPPPPDKTPTKSAVVGQKPPPWKIATGGAFVLPMLFSRGLSYHGRFNRGFCPGAGGYHPKLPLAGFVRKTTVMLLCGLIWQNHMCPARRQTDWRCGRWRGRPLCQRNDHYNYFTSSFLSLKSLSPPPLYRFSRNFATRRRFVGNRKRVL